MGNKGGKPKPNEAKVERRSSVKDVKPINVSPQTSEEKKETSSIQERDKTGKRLPTVNSVDDIKTLTKEEVQAYLHHLKISPSGHTEDDLREGLCIALGFGANHFIQQEDISYALEEGYPQNPQEETWGYNEPQFSVETHTNPRVAPSHYLQVKVPKCADDVLAMTEAQMKTLLDARGLDTSRLVEISDYHQVISRQFGIVLPTVKPVNHTRFDNSKFRQINQFSTPNKEVIANSRVIITPPQLNSTNLNSSSPESFKTPRSGNQDHMETDKPDLFSPEDEALMNSILNEIDDIDHITL